MRARSSLHEIGHNLIIFLLVQYFCTAFLELRESVKERNYGSRGSFAQPTGVGKKYFIHFRCFSRYLNQASNIDYNI